MNVIPNKAEEALLDYLELTSGVSSDKCIIECDIVIKEQWEYYEKNKYRTLLTSDICMSAALGNALINNREKVIYWFKNYISTKEKEVLENQIWC